MPESHRFDPCTIAMAAVLLVFSNNELDCVEFLSCVHPFYFSGLPSGVEDEELAMMEVDSCLQMFSMHCFAVAEDRAQRDSSSPVGVEERAFLEEDLSLDSKKRKFSAL